jgi:hypothetical protein
MSYDRRSAFERRANLHYDAVVDDAAWIAGEVVRKGKSHGWTEDPAEQQIAMGIEEQLTAYNIGYVGKGTWAHHPGGTRHFKGE